MSLISKSLNGLVAVISGAGRVNGVGAATAKVLASHGCHIMINCIKNKQQANEVLDSCRVFGVDAELYLGDLTKADACQEMASIVKNKWGQANILINSLGATKSASYEKLEQLNEHDFTHIFAVNVTAPYLMAQAFQPLLKESSHDDFSSTLINVSSAAGISGKASSIAYASAKGGLNTLTLALAQALSPEVRVNAVCPSFINSSWWEEAYADRPEKYASLVNSVREGNLLKKVLTPTDVANTLFSIINNPVMSGEIIRIDAGAHIGKANPRLDKESGSSFKL